MAEDKAGMASMDSQTPCTPSSRRRTTIVYRHTVEGESVEETEAIGPRQAGSLPPEGTMQDKRAVVRSGQAASDV